MKNLKYFPFERNKYYYGKLLTEQDFIGEQKYLNDKRRLSSRFLHGAGVAAGLNVVEVDEKNVSVEAGVAYDFSGRELVVDTPVMCRLSTVDGYNVIMEQEKSYAYLCIEYEEKEVSPAHNVVGDGNRQNQDYDKYKEGCHIYLTDREPDSLLTTAEALTEQTKVLYRDDQFVLTQTVPAYVGSGAVFRTVVRLENRGGSASISLRLTESLECAAWEGKKELEAVWENLLLERGQVKEQEFLLEARTMEQGEAVLTLKQDGLVLTTERGSSRCLEDVTVSVPVGQQDAYSRMKNQYYRDAMEHIVQENYAQGIYLARIYLVKTDKTYLIDRVENMPFDQYLYNCHLMSGLFQLLKQDVEKLKKEQLAPAAGTLQTGRTNPADQSEQWKAVTGTVEIPLGIGGKKGQRFFSQEIFHGLGLGYVNIELSVQMDDLALCGSSEIFEELDPKVELAAKLDMTKGAFVIGARMIEATSSQKLLVRWVAERVGGAEQTGTERRKLYIRPGRVELKVRESAWLEAVCEESHGMTILWNVKSPDGGSITADGMYTAPNSSGVYEVTAQCQEAPELKSSLFIIVRD